jgi:hypothetical protein
MNPGPVDNLALGQFHTSRFLTYSSKMTGGWQYGLPPIE